MGIASPKLARPTFVAGILTGTRKLAADFIDEDGIFWNVPAGTYPPTLLVEVWVLVTWAFVGGLVTHKNIRKTEAYISVVVSLGVSLKASSLPEPPPPFLERRFNGYTAALEEDNGQAERPASDETPATGVATIADQYFSAAMHIKPFANPHKTRVITSVMDAAMNHGRSKEYSLIRIVD